MDLRVYIDDIHRQLAAAAAAGGEESRAVAERLVGPLDAAIRLALQDVLAAAAEEITCDLAPGSVELRLRGRDPEFVVRPPPADLSPDDLAAGSYDGRGGGGRAASAATPTAGDADDSALTRINLRMPDHLKSRIEQAAGQEGLSVNSWLVRAAGAALDQTDTGRRPPPRIATAAQRYTGWAR